MSTVRKIFSRNSFFDQIFGNVKVETIFFIAVYSILIFN